MKLATLALIGGAGLIGYVLLTQKPAEQTDTSGGGLGDLLGGASDFGNKALGDFFTSPDNAALDALTSNLGVNPVNDGTKKTATVSGSTFVPLGAGASTADNLANVVGTINSNLGGAVGVTSSGNTATYNSNLSQSGFNQVQNAVAQGMFLSGNSSGYSTFNKQTGAATDIFDKKTATVASAPITAAPSASNAYGLAPAVAPNPFVNVAKKSVAVAAPATNSFTQIIANLVKKK